MGIGMDSSIVPSNDVKSEPVVADSIFWVTDVSTSTGLPITLGSEGMSNAPLPAGVSNLSWRCPCVCIEAMSALSPSFCCAAPASAGSSRVVVPGYGGGRGVGD